VFIMYKALDSLPSWKGFIFFISMIFFLSWLVKVFIISIPHIKVNGPNICIPPLTGKPEQERFTVQSGTLSRTREHQ